MTRSPSGSSSPRAKRGFSAVDLALLAVTVVWGFNNIVVKRALQSFLPLSFNALRFGLATIVIFLLLYLSEGRITVPRSGLRELFVVGFLGNTVYQVAFIKGLSMSSAGNVSFVLATMPATTALLAHLLKIELLPWRGWLGLGVTLAGALVIVTSSGGAFTFGGQTVVGDLVVLAGTLGWAMYTILSRRLTSRYSPMQLTAWTMGLGLLTLIPVCVPELMAQDWARLDALDWASLIGSSMLALVFSYVVWNWGLRQLGTARTAIYGNITPLWTGLFGWLLLGETWPPARIAGGMLILAGVALVRRALAATPPKTPGISATRPQAAQGR